MATTDQLRKAEQGPAMPLNSFPRERYILELEAVGQKGIRGLPKLELWKRVIAAKITIKPDWWK
jgi:hypothetical protein